MVNSGKMGSSVSSPAERCEGEDKRLSLGEPYRFGD